MKCIHSKWIMYRIYLSFFLLNCQILKLKMISISRAKHVKGTVEVISSFDRVTCTCTVTCTVTCTLTCTMYDSNLR